MTKSITKKQNFADYSAIIARFVFIIYFNASVIYSLPPLTRVLSGMLFLFFALIIALQGSGSVNKSIPVILMWAMVVSSYFCLVAINTSNAFWSVQRVSNLYQVILVAIAFVVISKKITFNDVSKLVAISVFWMSIYVILSSGAILQTEYSEIDLEISAARSNLSVWFALGIPFVFYALRYKKILMLLIITLILLAQIKLGGRNGILVSLVILTIISYKYWKKALPIGLMIAPLVLYFTFDQYYYQLRLDRFDGLNLFSIDIAALDYITAGRFSQYSWSIEKFKESPLFGHGFDSAFFNDYPIHNMYLRVLVEGGVLLLALLMYLPFKVLFTQRPEYQGELATIKLTIYGALIAALFEPYIIFGTMAYSIPVWIAVSYSLMISNAQSRSSHFQQRDLHQLGAY